MGEVTADEEGSQYRQTCVDTKRMQLPSEDLVESDLPSAEAVEAPFDEGPSALDALPQLMERIKSKDQSAMAELYVLCHAKVYRQVAYFIRDSQVANDVTQEVFLRIWRYAPTYDASKSTKAQAWINQVARNQVMTELARRSRRREDSDDLVNDQVDERAEPQQTARVMVRSPAFAAAMNALSPMTREVIVLRYFSDMSLQEIADELRLPLGTVKTWLHRGLARMRLELESGRSG